MIQCNIFCSVIFEYNIIIIIIYRYILLLLLCYKTQSSSVTSVMTAADMLLCQACLSLTLFLTGPILSHAAGLGSFSSL